MNHCVVSNYAKLKRTLFFLPVLLLLAVFLFLYFSGSLSVHKYVEVQKNSFFYINAHLGKFPALVYNLTQLGDISIVLSFVSILIVYAPKVWEALISALLVSVVFSVVLKRVFGVPRPAVAFDHQNFIIVGQKAVGYSSLPSGHSITVFTILTVLLFAFMPKITERKIAWFFLLIICGLGVAFTRVGVGAHYPLDVIVGSLLGYLAGISGVFLSRKFKVCCWINNTKYYPILMVLILIGCVSLVNRIMYEHLVIFYLALFSLTITLYKIGYEFIKKRH